MVFPGALVPGNPKTRACPVSKKKFCFPATWAKTALRFCLKPAAYGQQNGDTFYSIMKEGTYDTYFTSYLTNYDKSALINKWKYLGED